MTCSRVTHTGTWCRSAGRGSQLGAGVVAGVAGSSSRAGGSVSRAAKVMASDAGLVLGKPCPSLGLYLHRGGGACRVP